MSTSNLHFHEIRMNSQWTNAHDTRMGDALVIGIDFGTT
jgi:hypothetical protein